MSTPVLHVSVWRRYVAAHTRTRALFSHASIVTTLKNARHGVGVSREPAKLGGKDNLPHSGKDNPLMTAADSAEHTRLTIMS